MVVGASPAVADVPDALAGYVRARAADAAGDSGAATAGYRAVLRQSPGNAVVAMRAYREALTSGDMALARGAADTLTVAGVAPADVVLLDVSAAIRDRRWPAADAAADRLSAGPLDFLASAVKAWVAFGRKPGTASAMLPTAAKSSIGRRFNAENRALLMIAEGRPDAAMAELGTLIASGNDSADLRIAAAELLAARGRPDGARTLLAGDDPVLSAVREGLGRGMKPTPAFGVSRMFVRLAADLVAGEARPLAILLCRAALELDPRDDRARLTLAGALSNDGSPDRAMAVLDAVDGRGAYAASARSMAITTLSRAGNDSAALAVAERAATARTADTDDLQRLGDMLVAAGRHDDAARAYAMAMERGGADDWTLNLQRGGALEQAGKWEAALPFLRRAVELAPDQAHALNYLGYAQVDRGVNLDAARALLERAAALQPDDAAITDSLGWAYVRSGQVARAVPLLERAARAEPGDATISEHLGDAYWQVGRRYEARYAWRAAAVHADAVEAARLKTKLATGLTTAPAAKRPDAG